MTDSTRPLDGIGTRSKGLCECRRRRDGEHDEKPLYKASKPWESRELVAYYVLRCGPKRRAAASTPKDASSSGRWRRMPLVLRLSRGGVVVVHLFEREVDHDHLLEILSSVCCASALNKIGNRDTGYTKRHIRHRPGPARPDTVGSTRAPSNGMPTQSQTNRGSSLASSSPALAVAHPGAPRVRVPRTCRRRCRISSVSLIAALSPPPFVRPLADAPSRGPTVARHALHSCKACSLLV